MVFVDKPFSEHGGHVELRECPLTPLVVIPSIQDKKKNMEPGSPYARHPGPHEASPGRETEQLQLRGLGHEIVKTGTL